MIKTIKKGIKKHWDLFCEGNEKVNKSLLKTFAISILEIQNKDWKEKIDINYYESYDADVLMNELIEKNNQTIKNL